MRNTLRYVLHSEEDEKMPLEWGFGAMKDNSRDEESTTSSQEDVEVALWTIKRSGLSANPNGSHDDRNGSNASLRRT